MDLVKISEQIENVVVSMPIQWASDTVVTKVDVNPQTELDLAADAYLRTHLGRIVDAPIMSEEDPLAALGRTGLCWVVDPIDGTINAIAGADDFAVSVALVDAERLETLVAVVFVPRRARTYRAVRGHGSTRDGHALAGVPRHRSPTDRAYRLCAFGVPGDAPGVASRMGKALSMLYADGWVTRQCGSASIDICRTADGTWSAFWEYGLMYWDFAAASLAATESGCVIHTVPQSHGAAGGLVPLKFDIIVARDSDVMAQVRLATMIE